MLYTFHCRDLQDVVPYIQLRRCLCWLVTIIAFWVPMETVVTSNLFADQRTCNWFFDLNLNSLWLGITSISLKWLWLLLHWLFGNYKISLLFSTRLWGQGDSSRKKDVISDDASIMYVAFWLKIHEFVQKQHFFWWRYNKQCLILVEITKAWCW